jgi:hypothetical protein
MAQPPHQPANGQYQASQQQHWGATHARPLSSPQQQSTQLYQQPQQHQHNPQQQQQHNPQQQQQQHNPAQHRQWVPFSASRVENPRQALPSSGLDYFHHQQQPYQQQQQHHQQQQQQQQQQQKDPLLVAMSKLPPLEAYVVPKVASVTFPRRVFRRCISQESAEIRRVLEEIRQSRAACFDSAKVIGVHSVCSIRFFNLCFSFRNVSTWLSSKQNWIMQFRRRWYFFPCELACFLTCGSDHVSKQQDCGCGVPAARVEFGYK